MLDATDPRHGLSPATLLVWVLIAFAFTLIQIRQSLHYGRLAAPPTYDDIAYFVDAQKRVETLYTRGPGNAAFGALSHPPHSPWSTGLATAAFIVFGMKEWAPAASNGLIILALLLWISRRACGLPLPWQMVISVFVLTWPLSGQAVVNFRPDIACGLATAWTALYIVAGPWIAASRRRHYFAGAGLALALLIKPTLSPLTATIVLVALAAATLTDVVQGHPWRCWRPLAHGWTRCLGLGFLLALPYYAVANRTIFNYVYIHNFGELKEVWRPDLNGTEHALFYLTGIGGRLLLDSWLYLWLGLSVAVLGVALARRDFAALTRLPAAAVVFLVTYTLITVPDHKNDFLGAVLPSLMMLSAIEMMVYLAEKSRSVVAPLAPYARGSALLLLLIAGLALFHWPSYFRMGQYPPPQEVRQHRELLESVRSDILGSREGPNRVLFTQIGPYLNRHLLEYRLGLDRVPDVDFLDQSMSADLEKLDGPLAWATSVIAFSPGNPSAFRWLPAARNERQILDLLNADPRFYLYATYPSPRGSEVFLFTQPLGFRGIRPTAGFGPIEGPYPERALPFPVRWGLGTGSRFEIDAPSTGAVRLILEGTSPLPDQKMTVTLSGTVVGEHRFKSLDQFERIELMLEPSPGKHIVELDYSEWHSPTENDNRPLAVLFRTMLALDAGSRLAGAAYPSGMPSAG